MTTFNHTPIATGAAANAAVFNAPLGRLDAAVGDLTDLTTTDKDALVDAVNELDAGKQDSDAELNALAGLVSAANKVPYFTGSGTAALADFSAAGRALVDDATHADMLITLGLGDSATKDVGTTAVDVAAGTHTHTSADVTGLVPGHEIHYLSSLGVDTEYATRSILRVEGAVTVEDDAVNDRTKLIITGSEGGGASTLGDLTDVELTTVADTELLMFDDASSTWVNVPSAVSVDNAGFAPALPASSGESKYLRGDGAWEGMPGYQTIVSAEAGEVLVANEMVYLKQSDKKWYKISVEAVPPACSAQRGCVLAGKDAGEIADVIVDGVVTGFTGLVEFAAVYADGVGSYTQTKPTVGLDNQQRVIVALGTANNDTDLLISPQPVRYVKRARLNACTDLTTVPPITGGVMTIEHHEDPPEQNRDVNAWIMSFDKAGETNLTDNGFVDTAVEIAFTSSNTAKIGYDVSSATNQVAQKFLTPSTYVTGGLAQFSFTIASNNIPSVTAIPGNITWQLYTHLVAGDRPNAAVGVAPSYSGTIVPIVGTNIVTIDGALLTPATYYWLVLKPAVTYPAVNSYWNVKLSTDDTAYADGTLKTSLAGTTTWVATTKDMECTFNFRGIESGKYDNMIALRGHEGETIGVTATSGTSYTIGTKSGTDYRLAQSFTPTVDGYLEQIDFSIASITGSPDVITWEICANNAGNPADAALKTGTKAGEVGTNAIALTDLDVYVTHGTLYWLKLYMAGPVNGNYYSTDNSATTAYAYGTLKDKAGAGAWTDRACDLSFHVVVKKLGGNSIAQKFQVSEEGYIGKAMLYMTKYGSLAAHNLTVSIREDNAGAPSTVVTATSNAVVSSVIGSTPTIVTFVFQNPPSVFSGIDYWLVLDSNMTYTIELATGKNNYMAWCADWSSGEYAAGDIATYKGTTWTDRTDVDGIFAILGPTVVYDEKIAVGSWSLREAKMRCRFDDGTGLNPDTKTTIKNYHGGSLDVTMEVELP